MSKLFASPAHEAGFSFFPTVCMASVEGTSEYILEDSCKKFSGENPSSNTVKTGIQDVRVHLLQVSSRTKVNFEETKEGNSTEVVIKIHPSKDGDRRDSVGEGINTIEAAFLACKNLFLDPRLRQLHFVASKTSNSVHKYVNGENTVFVEVHMQCKNARNELVDFHGTGSTDESATVSAIQSYLAGENRPSRFTEAIFLACQDFFPSGEFRQFRYVGSRTSDSIHKRADGAYLMFVEVRMQCNDENGAIVDFHGTGDSAQAAMLNAMRSHLMEKRAPATNAAENA